MPGFNSFTRKLLIKQTTLTKSVFASIIFFLSSSAISGTICELPWNWNLKECIEWRARRDAERARGSESCLAVMTHSYYEFRINNETVSKVGYAINGKDYLLESRQGRNHKEPKCFGTNSCNVKCSNEPEIEFDYSYSSGIQSKKYGVVNTRSKTSGNLEMELTYFVSAKLFILSPLIQHPKATNEEKSNV